VLNLFTESVHVTVDDIHFIVGPNITNVSKDSDYKDANSAYDLQDPIKNILRMFAQQDQAEKD
jgi:hypothetical protein